MTCDELREHLIDHLRGGGDRAAVEAHLAGCAACREEAASLALAWERLGRWPDEVPGPRLRARVLDALDAEAPAPHARPAHWRTPAPYLRAAAALLLVAAGAWLGARYAGPAPLPPDPRAEFVLLLYEDTAAEAALTPEEARRTVEEYKGWARGLAREGSLVGGDKLAEERRVLASGAGPELPAGVALGGYFVIRAGSLEEAAAIARGCPHLAHGGTIELRRIEPV